MASLIVTNEVKLDHRKILLSECRSNFKDAVEL
jgi:hypothetical protein